MRILSVLLASSCCLLQAEASAPLVEVLVPDGQRTVERFQGSALGMAWNRPDLASLRKALWTRLDAFLAEVKDKQDQANPVTLVPTMWAKGQGQGMALRLVMDGGSDGGVEVRMRVADGEPVAQWAEGLEPWVRDKIRVFDFGAEVSALVGVGEPGADLAALASVEEDLVVRWDAERIAQQVGSQAGFGRDLLMAGLIREFLSSGQIGFRFIREGLTSELRLAQRPAGLVPLDARGLGTMPLPTSGFLAVGVDGSQWWAAHEPGLRALLESQGQAEAIAVADQVLSGFGVPGGLAGLLAEFKGEVIAIGEPTAGLFGGIALAIPRGPGIDRLVAAGLGFLQVMPPAEGRFSVLSMRPPRGNGDLERIVFGGACVGRSATHWWISSDVVMLSDMLEGKRPALASTEQGKEILAGIDAGTSAVMAGDGRMIMRAAIPLAVMGGGLVPTPDGADALARAMLDLYRASGPSAVFAKDDGSGFVIKGSGVDGGVALLMPQSVGLVAIVAAIAIPNLLESRVTSQEAAAATSLKSGVLPAMVMFQGGGYCDADNDGIGEYGTFPVMAGAVPTPHGLNLNLLAPTFNADAPVISGYRFHLFLPDGKGGATSELRHADVTGADDRERVWVAYAIPIDPGQGRRMFAITQAGNVYASLPGVGPFPNPPAFDLLWNGKDPWIGKPADGWTPYRR